MTDPGRRHTLVFTPQAPSWHPERQAVRFAGEDGTRVVACFVTRPLLCALTGRDELDAAACLAAFAAHRARIETLAAQRYAALAPRAVAEIYVRIGDPDPRSPAGADER